VHELIAGRSTACARPTDVPYARLSTGSGTAMELLEGLVDALIALATGAIEIWFLLHPLYADAIASTVGAPGWAFDVFILVDGLIFALVANRAFREWRRRSYG
jgi:hypothetical protein